MSLATSALSLGLLSTISATLTVSYLVFLVFLSIFCPLLYLRLQKYKK